MHAIKLLGPNYLHAFQPSDDLGVHFAAFDLDRQAAKGKPSLAAAAAGQGGYDAAARQAQLQATLDKEAQAAQVAQLFDGGVASHIWLSYNAKACDGEYAFDNTPEANGRSDGWHAKLLGRTMQSGTQACVTRKLSDIMTARPAPCRSLLPHFVPGVPHVASTRMRIELR